jgi:hypothetical protein
MYADRPGGGQSIPSVDTKPTAEDKQPFIALLETRRLLAIRPFTQKFGHPRQLDFLDVTGIQITDKSMMVTTNQKMRLGISLKILN